MKAENPHVLNISPPLNIESHWFAPHTAYTIAKFNMSLCVLGMAENLKKKELHLMLSGQRLPLIQQLSEISTDG